MPIHMGIKCDVCQTVHFVATSRSISLRKSVEGMYRLTCQPPCHEVREFRKEGMHPYRVSDEVFKRGYAEEGEYELVQGISLRSARVPPAGQRSARAALTGQRVRVASKHRSANSGGTGTLEARAGSIGFYSAEAQAQRRLTRDLLKANLEFLKGL